MDILRIVSKKAGFRRGGIAHPDRAMIYPASRFTEEQREQLKAEPNLDVIENAVPDIELPENGMPADDFMALVNADKESAKKGAAKT